MAVNLPPLGALSPVAGVRLATACAGIRQTERDDLALLVFPEGTTAGAVFTQSGFKAAPVVLARRHLARSAPRAFVINSGNANAATGRRGLDDARRVCGWVAESLGVAEAAVVPFSTGVIGERLPLEKIGTAIPAAVAALEDNAWAACAAAIMTTDTAPKALSKHLSVGGVDVTLTGMAKGAGMIRPDMATMLAFIATDAAVTGQCLQRMVEDAADASFNRITIDGDTSTNDAFVAAATGAAGNPVIAAPSDPGGAALAAAITELARELAQRIVRDGEGATKLIRVAVNGGRNRDECLQVAYTIAQSPLVKTALFAGDPNWGRFCMAIGRAGLEALDTDRVALYLDDVCVAEHGMIASGYREEDGARVLRQDELTVRVALGRGDASETVWTSDLSYEYVRINAEYRS